MGTQTTHTRAALDRLRAAGRLYLAVARRAHWARDGTLIQAGHCADAGACYWRMRSRFAVNWWAIEHVDHVRGNDE